MPNRIEGEEKTMRSKLYLETSIISYLTALPSRDLLVAANQQITHDWWENRREQFDIYSSQLVIQEASSGDPEFSQKRLNILKDIPVLTLREEMVALADRFVQKHVLPAKAGDDALHIAIATVYGLDYLLTWNCKHIANAEIQKKLVIISSEEGYELPTICTPIELMGE
jgi:hypothetical protein